MNYIYIHVSCIGNYIDVFDDLIKQIKKSGLYDKVEQIRCCVLGNSTLSFSDSFSDKIVLRKSSVDLSLYEAFTINTIREDIKVGDFNVLYLHTKGVTKCYFTQYVNIKSWVDYMCYFNITHHAKCIELLKENDTVGVNINSKPEIHYSGNFWWSKSSYLRKLNECTIQTYNSPEFWLTEQKKGNFVSLWQSKINHYLHYYDESNYKNKGVKILVYQFV